MDCSLDGITDRTIAYCEKPHLNTKPREILGPRCHHNIPSLDKPFGGCLQIRVGRQGLVNEPIERRIVVQLPPIRTKYFIGRFGYDKGACPCQESGTTYCGGSYLGARFTAGNHPHADRLKATNNTLLRQNPISRRCVIACPFSIMPIGVDLLELLCSRCHTRDGASPCFTATDSRASVENH